MSEFTQALGTLSKAFERGEVTQEACFDVSDTTMGLEIFDQSEIQALCSFLRNEEAARKAETFGSFLLDMEVSYLRCIPSEARSAVFGALKSSYRFLDDAGACMVALEIMTKLFPGERSLSALMDLAGPPQNWGRALIPYGLYDLYRTTDDSVVQDGALAELERLSHDEEERTRREAEWHLAKVLSLKKEKEKNWLGKLVEWACCREMMPAFGMKRDERLRPIHLLGGCLTIAIGLVLTALNESVWNNGDPLLRMRVSALICLLFLAIPWFYLINTAVRADSRSILHVIVCPIGLFLEAVVLMGLLLIALGLVG